MQLVKKDRSKLETLFFFSLDFLENSTHNPMRYCIQASVLLLFCGICMCVMCVHLP